MDNEPLLLVPLDGRFPSPALAQAGKGLLVVSIGSDGLRADEVRDMTQPESRVAIEIPALDRSTNRPALAKSAKGFVLAFEVGLDRTNRSVASKKDIAMIRIDGEMTPSSVKLVSLSPIEPP